MDEPAQVRYRRWPRLVGGDNDDQPVSPEAWSGHVLQAPKNIPLSGALLWSTDPKAESQMLEIEQYRMRQITVGQTRLVLRVFVEDSVSEAQAMEMIWDRLLEQVGA